MVSTLDGITVLDFGSGTAAALASMFMSDHGARVIRVIDKDDDALRDGGFVIWDRGKECVARAGAMRGWPHSSWRAPTSC